MPCGAPTDAGRHGVAAPLRDRTAGGAGLAAPTRGAKWRCPCCSGGACTGQDASEETKDQLGAGDREPAVEPHEAPEQVLGTGEGEREDFA